MDANSLQSGSVLDAIQQPEPKIIANDWVQLRELLNKVWDLGLLLLLGCSGGAYELLCQVLFQRVYRAFNLMWSASVVLHDRG